MLANKLQLPQFAARLSLYVGVVFRCYSQPGCHSAELLHTCIPLKIQQGAARLVSEKKTKINRVQALRPTASAAQRVSIAIVNTVLKDQQYTLTVLCLNVIMCL